MRSVSVKDLKEMETSKFVETPKFKTLVKKTYGENYEAYVDKKLTISKIAALAFKAGALLFSAGMLLCFERGRIWAKEIRAGGEIVAVDNVARKQLGQSDWERNNLKKFSSALRDDFPDEPQLKGLDKKIDILNKKDLKIFEDIFDSIDDEIFGENWGRIDDFSIFETVANRYIQFTVVGPAKLRVSVACWPPEIDLSGKGHIGNWSIGKTKEQARQISTLNNEEINFLVCKYVARGLNSGINKKFSIAREQSDPFIHGIIIEKVDPPRT
ncbi:hypothetical protein PHSC3_002074 [Chlamydiales bacterium STE3]|nr:hypothetical protein PHSC3_002074 [Chlamydiales bacterium STE3]